MSLAFFFFFFGRRIDMELAKELEDGVFLGYRLIVN